MGGHGLANQNKKYYEEHSYLKRKIYSGLQIQSEAKSITTNKTRILNYLKNIIWEKMVEMENDGIKSRISN